jgi:two-component system chemotaxis response regulator CheY
MKILTVDDSKAARVLIKHVIARLGHEAIEAINVDEALAVLKREAQEIDLVVLDLHMPGRSGLDCLQLMRSNPRTRSIPVLMLTADPSSDAVEAALRAGAQDYLTKPFAPTVLAAKIKQCLEPGESPSR